MASEETKTNPNHFEALGRFVQAFELMVNATRIACTSLLRSPWSDDTGPRLNIILHHRALTALPLFEIFRALAIHVMSDPREGYADDDCRKVSEALAYASNAYNNLSNIRNDILHATWYIGQSDPDRDDFSKEFVKKYKVSKNGLTSVNVPNDVVSINNLSSDCSEMEWLITQLCIYFTPYHTIPLDHQIKFEMANGYQ